MPSSALPLVPAVVTLALEHRPKSVLDVGVGHGKYGLLLREYAPWLERLDGLEAEPRYLKRFPWLTDIYDHLAVGTASGHWLGGYEPAVFDVVLMVDVLEHLDHDAGAELLALIPGRVVICTPRDFFQNPCYVEYPSEMHRSVWTAEEIAAIRPLEVDDVFAASIGGVLVRTAPL